MLHRNYVQAVIDSTLESCILSFSNMTHELANHIVSPVNSGPKSVLLHPLAKCVSDVHQRSEIDNFPPILQTQKGQLSEGVG